jgi:hypothetical protein
MQVEPAIVKAMRVEVRLRVPNMKVRALDENGYPIDHSSVRFRKTMEVLKLPKRDETLELVTSSGRVLQATVVRADLDEGRGLFVLSCQYATRSISPEDYAALANDPDWELKLLLE